MTFLEIASREIAAGIPVIPVQAGQKSPPLNVGGSASASTDPEQIAAWAEQFPDANVGVVATLTGILIVDDDDGVVEQSGIPVRTRVVESSPGHKQYYFRHTAASAEVGNIPQRAGFSLRSHNYYGLAAGGRHPDGHDYRMLVNGPIQPMPADLLAYLQEKYATAKGRALNGSLGPLEHKLGPGDGRNDDMIRIAGMAWDGEISEEEHFEQVKYACEMRHDPPYPKGRMLDAVRRMREKQPAHGIDWADLLPADDPRHGPKIIFRSDIEPPSSWLVDADEFIARKLEPRKPYLIDSRTNGVVLFEKSLNQLFAFRGLGKSVVVNSLIKPLLTGEDWLHFSSPGGLRVLLVDGELPAVQLQERLREFTGDEYGGRFKLISPELLPNPKDFPVLSRVADQRAFLRQIEEFAPHVIVFDTLSRCFKFDTNDPDTWVVVNDFLIELRMLGYCVILVHHAGKNNTSRGLTTGDDNLDVSVQLEKRRGWEPGEGLQFEWQFAKVRHGAWLPGFEAGYDKDTKTWAILEDNSAARVAELVAEGKAERAIAAILGISQKSVNRIKHKTEQLEKLNRGGE
jgi:hypothetical protein